jgi:hypothetical protein
MQEPLYFFGLGKSEPSGARSQANRGRDQIGCLCLVQERTIRASPNFQRPDASMRLPRDFGNLPVTDRYLSCFSSLIRDAAVLGS